MRLERKKAFTYVLTLSCLLVNVAAVPLAPGRGKVAGVSASRELIVAVKSKSSREVFESVWANAGQNQHLSLEEICEQFGPKRSSVEAVLAWASLHGASDVKATRSLLCPVVWSSHVLNFREGSCACVLPCL